MTNILFSRKAEEDIIAIDRYSYITFGKRVADAYADRLHKHIQLIADNPKLGRALGHTIRKGYRCLEHESHIIFYRVKKASVEIVRVLHKKQDRKRVI